MPSVRAGRCRSKGACSTPAWAPACLPACLPAALLSASTRRCCCLPLIRRPRAQLPSTQAGDGCDDIIVLQEGAGTRPLDPLPLLPPNARYLRHPNSCLDFGTVGWVLDHHVPNAAAYQFFLWANPSVRGPLLPAYLRGRMHWTEPFLSKLSPAVKLVGCTINCGGTEDRPYSTHVQSYVAATDATGLAVLRRTGTVFRCWNDYRKTVLASEMGASEAIFAAGYTIDSLMLRYQVGRRRGASGA